MKNTLHLNLITLLLFCGLAIQAQVTTYLTPPYSTGFESGTLDANWYTTADNPGGRIQIWNSTSLIWAGDTAMAHTGDFWLGMDHAPPGGSFVTTESWMGLDLSGSTGYSYRLSFWWAEWNEEYQVQDGLYISDNGGTTFTKVLDLEGNLFPDLTWQYFDFDLDSLNTFHGLSTNSANYVIKFQQYDNFYFAGGNDGFLIDDISVYASATPNTWTGNTSTDWSDGTNWSELTVPTSADVVFIPTAPVGGLFPTTTTDIEVGNLNVQPMASLDIAPGLGLTIATDGSVTNNGAINLKSSPTSTAWLDDFSNTGTAYNGNITVEQAVTAGSGLGQRLVGSPVAGGVIAGIDATYAGAGANGQVVMSDCLSGIPDVGTPYSNLFEWQEDASSPNNCEYEGWFAIDAATALTNGRAYSAWLQDGSTISFTGAPNTDDINYGGGTLGNSASGVAAKDGWHLLANPYPSAVDVSDLTATQGWASLSTYNAASAPAGGTYQPIMPGQNLGSAQGFAAQTTTSPSFLGDVVFDNTMRVAGNETLKANDDWFISKLDIAVNGPETQDFSYLYFNDEASAAFDNVWDCEKRSSIAGKATLFTSLDERPLSLNGNNIQDLGTTSYPLGLTPAVSGAYEFVFNGLETFDGEFEILLEDKLTDSWTNLRTDNNYSFEMSTADHNDRFEIHFNKTATGVNDLLAGQATVRATATDIVVTLDGVDADNAASVQVYDAVGQIVSSIDNAGQLVNIDMTQNAHGIYFVSVSIGSAQNTFKVIY